jgi:hypothetical protein
MVVKIDANLHERIFEVELVDMAVSIAVASMLPNCDRRDHGGKATVVLCRLCQVTSGL